ncbi:MAG: hypothetical protein K2H72_09110 [Muribaculaceae bacterium]|nr:hypothetical protein [Muribaculaceae bacterium]
MKFKSLLMVAAASVAFAQASAFEWKPLNLYPNPIADIQDLYFMQSVSFNSSVDGVTKTDVMPVWIDENGNEVKAVSGEQNPWGFDPTSFTYSFNSSSIKSNGEYTLLFPEGMLVNEAGEKSDEVKTPYTLNDPANSPAMFDDFEVLSITPGLSQDQAIWNNQVVTLNTNHNDAIGFTKLTVTDITTGEVLITSSNFTVGRELGDSSPISWEVVGEYKFYQEHIYSAEFVFYNGKDEANSDGEPYKIVGRATFDFAGKVEGYKYSEIELLDIQPAPYSIVISEPEQAVFTYTFSGPVTVYQAETPLGQNGKNVYPPSCLSSNEDKTVWTLDLSNDDYVKTVDSMLTIYIYAKDMDGYQLRGDWGEEGESCFVGEWQCDLGAFPIVVVAPEAGETLDRLSEIVVKSESGAAMSWSWTGEAFVINQLGEILGQLVYETPEGEEDSALKEFHFSKWMDDDWNVAPIDLVKEGFYAVQFGPGCFAMGDQFESKQSKSATSTFIISGVLDDTPDDPVVDPSEQEVFKYDRVSPESGSTVACLDKLYLWFPDIVDTTGKDVIVYNKADQSVVSYGQVAYDWDDLYLINLDVFDPVTVAGEYEVVIPARAICDGEFFESDGKKGICNPEIKLTYTVDPEYDAVDSVAADKEADVYDLHGRLVLRNASSASIKTLPKGIYVVGSRKVVVK